MTECLLPLMPLPELTAMHDRFLALSQIARERGADSPGGQLLLRCGVDAGGIATIVAASVAGAASLCVDQDADRLREGLRAGHIDFVVATLDEALRILKNEVRRALPVSVGLIVDPAPSVDAMIERGLQPDLLSAVPEQPAAIFLERGAIALPAQHSAEPGTSVLAWSVTGDVAQSMPRIAQLASGFLDAARADTPARRRWLERSPRYLGRALSARQCLLMTASEAAGFEEGLRAAFPAARLTRRDELR